MSTKRARLTNFPPRVLSIGGSDSGGSAGIQADLKTFEACGVFGCSAITVVTAQDTQKVHQAMPLSPQMISAQVQVVLDDIGADAIKTGLLGRAEVVEQLVNTLQTYMIKQVVVDPVIMNGLGHVFVDEATLQAYCQHLFPLATVMTPNLDEAALLSGVPIQNQEDLAVAAKKLYQFGCDYVVIKGGHLSEGQIINLIYDGKTMHWLFAERLPVQNPHGVGCTLASAIAANLAHKISPITAIGNAFDYLHRALRGSLNWQLGQGRLPVYHAIRHK